MQADILKKLFRNLWYKIGFHLKKPPCYKSNSVIKMDKFDDYEKDILKSYERDEWISENDLEEKKKNMLNMQKLLF